MTERGAGQEIAEWIPDASAETVAAWIATRLRAPGAHVIAVPGGSTPKPILEALAAQGGIAWPRVTVWLGDDRCVAAEHPASNFGQLARALGHTGATLTPLREGDVPPNFDVMWIGVGEDGHIASLFPNVDPQPDAPRVVQRITPDPLPPEAPFPRLTLTLPAIANAQRIILVAKGARKKAVLEAAIANAARPGEQLAPGDDLPITRLLRLARGRVTIFWSPS
jgi:6-phosphogluconolactonase